jgi:hypothetical protein
MFPIPPLRRPVALLARAWGHSLIADRLAGTMSEDLAAALVSSVLPKKGLNKPSIFIHSYII